LRKFSSGDGHRNGIVFLFGAIAQSSIRYFLSPFFRITHFERLYNNKYINIRVRKKAKRCKIKNKREKEKMRKRLKIEILLKRIGGGESSRLFRRNLYSP